jgi:hypothetical protein
LTRSGIERTTYRIRHFNDNYMYIYIYIYIGYCTVPPEMAPTFRSGLGVIDMCLI